MSYLLSLAAHALTILTIPLLADHITAAPTEPLSIRQDGGKAATTFTDATTGITFQRFFGARTNFAFGVALPAATDGQSSSFIGTLSFPLGTNGAGWGGWSLTDDMEGPLLMAAWASSDRTRVISSFRQASNEDDNPPEVSGDFRLRPIPSGTSVNGTFLTYTFLCENCLGASLGRAPPGGAAAAAGGGATLGGSKTNGTILRRAPVEMGWALSSRYV